MKSDTEINVLRNFLNACPEFSGKLTDIKSCVSNEPDCLCEFSNGTKIYFELSEIVDQKMAQKFNDPKLAFNGGFFTDDILIDRVTDKLSKFYETKGLDVELLLYFDLQPPWPEATMADQVEDVLNDKGKGLFKKVWLFSVPRGRVIGSF